MLRWQGFTILAVLIILFVVLGLIFTDLWLENKIEDTGSAINKAKVEIDGLDFSFTELKLKWDRLQVTDPKNTWKNIVETGTVEFDMEFLPLLSKKVIIENIQISDVRSGTQRETDGKIEKEKIDELMKDNFVGQTIDNLNKQVSSTVSTEFGSFKRKVNTDSILALLNIRSIGRIDSLQKNLTKKYDDWQTNLNNINVQTELTSLEKQINAMDVKKVKTVEDFRSAVNAIDQVKSSVNSLVDRVNDTKKNMENDFQSSKKGISSIDDWIAEDYKSALSKAKLPQFGAGNIGEMIFGKSLIDQFNSYLGYIGKAREYSAKLKSDEPEKKKPPRLKGQDIYFYTENARPDFWIKNINLSGLTPDEIELKGVAKNIVSDQRQIGKKTEIEIAGKSAKKASVSFDGLLNYLGDFPEENFNLEYSGFSLAHTKLSRTKFLPNEVLKGFGAVNASLKLAGEQIDGNIKFAGNNLVFDFSNQPPPKNKLEEIINSVVRSVNYVTFTAKIKGKNDNLKFSLDSNLDDLFAEKIKSIVGEEVNKAKQKIKSKIDSEVNKRREQLTTLVKEKEAFLNSEIEKYKKQVDEKVKLADEKKKELEKEFEKQKSKIGDKLKGLFNKETKK